MVRGVLALVVAVAAAGILVARSTERPRPPDPRPPGVETVWPHARRADVPGALPDGTAYRAAYFVDERASVGTADDPGGAVVRLVMRAADGAVRVLRRLPRAAAPQYAAVTRIGDELVWAESVTGPDGTVRTTLWRAALSGGAPRMITGDTGRAAFFGSEHDIVANAGRLYWTARAPGSAVATEVRSVRIGGGAVDVRTEPGVWTLSSWPWLASASSSGRAQLRDIATARVVAVDAAGDMLDKCGPTWCRVFAWGGNGPVRCELMRLDGSERVRVADGVIASVVDVAVLDRFEVYSERAGALGAALGARRLFVYDLKTRQSITVSEAAAESFYRAGILWWSTRAGDRLTWHTLDLRTV